jgi:hypothetical protein
LDVERGRVLVVNQSFTHLVLGDQNPVGRRIRITHSEEDGVAADDGWYEVVGMVRDVGWQMPQPSEQAAIYHPALLQPGRALSVAVRVRDPLGFAPRLRLLANGVDPDMQLTDVRLMTDAGGRAAGRRVTRHRHLFRGGSRLKPNARWNSCWFPARS